MNTIIHQVVTNMARITAPKLEGHLVAIVLQSRIFRNWILSLDSRFNLQSIEIQTVFFRGGEANASDSSLLFLQLLVKIDNAPYEQVVILRGGTVAILIVLKCKNERYVVLVKQPRLPSGQYDIAELPAGMLGGQNHKSAAIQELEEEVGLVFQESNLIDLTGMIGESEGLFASPGLTNEQVRFQLIEKEVTMEEILELQKKPAGLVVEGETTEVWVVPLEEIWKSTRDGKAFIAISLYLYYLQESGQSRPL